MKLCTLIYRGQVVEVTIVADDHPFGDHGNHWHVEVQLRKTHMCVENPTLEAEDHGDVEVSLRDPGLQ